MKKAGAKPILDTYVQLAHCINTLQRLQKGKTPPKVRYTLDIVARLGDFDDWSEHKGIGIFMTLVAKACLRISMASEEEGVLPPLIEAGKKVWEKTNPFDHGTKLTEEDKERLLTHYLFVLSLSSNNEDLNTAVNLLPRALEFPSTESRRSALRIALSLNDSEMAKYYWQKFITVKFDEISAILYLRILSQGFYSKDAADILDQLIALKPSYKPHAKIYLLALLSCLRLPNLNTAMRIYDKVLDNPTAKEDFRINDLMLRIFARGTQSDYALRKHKPDYIYSILRTLDMPRLMKRTDVSSGERLQLVQKAKQLISWRSNSPNISTVEHQVVEGDFKFYERWEKIIRNSVTPRDNRENAARQESRGGNLNRGDRGWASMEPVQDKFHERPAGSSASHYERRGNDRKRDRYMPTKTPAPRKYAPAHRSMTNGGPSRINTRTPSRDVRQGVDQRRWKSSSVRKLRVDNLGLIPKPVERGRFLHFLKVRSPKVSGESNVRREQRWPRNSETSSGRMPIENSTSKASSGLSGELNTRNDTGEGAWFQE